MLRPQGTHHQCVCCRLRDVCRTRCTHWRRRVRTCPSSPGSLPARFGSAPADATSVVTVRTYLHPRLSVPDAPRWRHVVRAARTQPDCAEAQATQTEPKSATGAERTGSIFSQETEPVVVEGYCNL